MRMHCKDTREKEITLDLWKRKSGFAYCLFACFQSPYKLTGVTFFIVLFSFLLTVKLKRLVSET